MRTMSLLLAALWLCGLCGCGESGTKKLDGRTKIDGRIKVDRGKIDAGKADAAPADLGAPDTKPWPDQFLADLPKIDAPKIDAPKTDVAKTDAAKIDGPKMDVANVDAAKSDGPKTDAAKSDLPKIDGPKSDFPPFVGKLVINEVDYDQVGSDTKEFVEIYNGTSAPIDMATLALVLVNGSNNTEYTRVLLGPAGILPAGGYLVVCSSNVTVDAAAKKILFLGTSDQVQNGPPDGVALINTTTKTVLDALAYEGSIAAATLTGFTTTPSLVEGTVLDLATADSNASEGSLVRWPNGSDTNNANVDWRFSATPTPGKANVYP